MKLLLDHLGEALAVVNQPRVGLIVDFDGTISEMAPIPDEARISGACAAALDSLSSRLALVAVLSGRAADDLKGKVELEGVLYVGQHGAEYLDGVQRHVVPPAADYRERISEVFDELKSKVPLPSLVWQGKGLAASVHYRQASDPKQVRRLLTAALEATPAAAELEIFWGKMVLELRSPTGLDKGHAIRKTASDRNLSGLIFLGDDTTDIAAVRAVNELAAKGALQGLAAAVLNDDSPDALLEAADYGLNGVPEVERFLEWLVENAG